MMPYPNECEKFLPTALTDQSFAFRLALWAHLTVRCWASRQDSSGFTCRHRAMIPAANGALALVPVWEEVQICLKSVVTTLRSPAEPELYVDARVDAHASEYLQQ